MPIRVEYGAQVSPGLPAMAQTAMRIRAEAAAAALRAARGSGGGGGGGRGGSRRGGGSSTASGEWAAYNESRLLEQKAEIENQQAEYEQGLKEQGFDYEYTAKAKQEFATFNNSLQMINASNELSEEEKITARRSVELQRAGVEKSVIPAEKEKFPEGKRMGDSWENEHGGVSYRDKDGQERLLLKPDETAAGIKAQQDYDRQETEDKWIVDLSTEMVDDGEGGKRTREPNEIAKAIFVAESAKEELEKMRAEKQQLQELIESGAADWVQQSISKGVDIQQMDVDLGPVMGPIQATARQLINKPNRTPDEENDLQALLIRIRNYDPDSGIEEFAVREEPRIKGLKKKEPFELSSMTGLF